MRYIGKDIVTRGAALVLDRDQAWGLLRSRARQGVRKAERAGVQVVESRDLSLLAAVWYDSATLPARLAPEQRLFAAHLGSTLLGAIIITPVSPNTLFYHFGGTNELGRAVEANAFLLWHVVKIYDHHPRFRFLDVGVSFRHKLQHYFQKYCTHSYPILFNPPHESVLPRINVNPFDASCFWNDAAAEAGGEDGADVDALLQRRFGRPFTWTPDERQALRASLKALGLQSDDLVSIFPSLKTSRVAPAVTETIEDVCRWSMKIEPRTRALLVIHQWGLPHPETEAIRALGLPVIEDCSASFTSTLRGRPVGSFGDYAVFSLRANFPMQHGGLLVGRAFGDREIWDRFGCLDVAKRNAARAGLSRWWPGVEEAAERRRENWNYLDRHFRMLGLASAFRVDREVTPAAYVVRLSERFPPSAVRERMSRFGVECGICEGGNAVFLPCHQNLGEPQLDYIFGAFRGMVNPCHTYRRPDEARLEQAAALEPAPVREPAAIPEPVLVPLAAHAPAPARLVGAAA